MLRVSADASELVDLVGSGLAGGRRVVGVAGAPGSGKSRLATALAQRLGPRAAHVPMDGFHLADAELSRLGLLDSKGAPDTFDAWGYAALLQRLRPRASYAVYAPAFERGLEQPVAGAIAVGPSVEVVLTEGSYLLLDRPGWREVRAQLDEVWYVVTRDPLRRERLLARHVEHGKSALQAAAWVDRVDEPNARLVEQTRSGADRLVDLSLWNGTVGRRPRRTGGQPVNER